MTHPQRGPKYLSKAILVAFFLLGIIVTGWGFCAFLKHNEIATGGLPGLSLILFRQFGFDPSLSMWLIGLPIFAIGWIMLGRNASLSSLAGFLLLPASIYLFSQFPNTHIDCKEPLVASLAGGFIVGVGLGFVFKANASTGGFTLIARIVSQHSSLSIAKCIMLLDGSILLTAFFLYGAEKSIIGFISVVAISKGIEAVQAGLGKTKCVTVITEHPEEVKAILYQRIDCGITEVDAVGGHSGGNKKMLICIIPISKLARAKRNIIDIDPKAFTIVSDAAEVVGYGF